MSNDPTPRGSLPRQKVTQKQEMQPVEPPYAAENPANPAPVPPVSSIPAWTVPTAYPIQSVMMPMVAAGTVPMMWPTPTYLAPPGRSAFAFAGATSIIACISILHRVGHLLAPKPASLAHSEKEGILKAEKDAMERRLIAKHEVFVS